MDKKVSSLLNEYVNNYPIKYVVVIVWISPFGNLEHRSGAFEEYMEAEEFVRHLKDKYDSMNITYSIYINGKII